MTSSLGYRAFVVGADLYSQPNVYSKGLKVLAPDSGSGDGSESFFTNSALSNHDLLANFRILKRLWSSGLVVGGPRLQWILDKTDDEYMRLLEISLGESRR